MSRIKLLVGLLLGSLLLAGCAAPFKVSAPIDQTVAWKGYSALEVVTRNGSIDVASDAAQADVAITGMKYASGPTPAAAEENLAQVFILAEPKPDDPACLRVAIQYPEVFEHNGAKPSARLTIRVPDSCDVNLRTSNGAVTARRLHDAVIRTSNGAIAVEELGGDLQARSSNGAIKVTQVAGKVTLSTSNGAINARDTGPLHAETSNGRVELQSVQAPVFVDTSNGRIVCHGDFGPDASVELSTSNGHIEVSMPTNLHGVLDCATANGSIQANLDDLAMQNVDISRRHFKATLNGGGDGRLVVRTSNGSIQIVRPKPM